MSPPQIGDNSPVDLSHLDTEEAKRIAHSEEGTIPPHQRRTNERGNVVYTTESPPDMPPRLVRAQQQARKEASSTPKKGKKVANRKRHRTGIQKEVFRAMQDNIGMHMTPQRIVDEIPDLTTKQAGNGMYQLWKKGLLRKAADGIYVYDGKDAETRTPTHAQAPGQNGDATHLYETIGQLQDGTAVVKSDDGQLYVLETIEAHFRSLST